MLVIKIGVPHRTHVYSSLVQGPGRAAQRPPRCICDPSLDMQLRQLYTLDRVHKNTANCQYHNDNCKNSCGLQLFLIKCFAFFMFYFKNCFQCGKDANATGHTHVSIILYFYFLYLYISTFIYFCFYFILYYMSYIELAVLAFILNNACNKKYVIII